MCYSNDDNKILFEDLFKVVAVLIETPSIKTTTTTTTPFDSDGGMTVLQGLLEDLQQFQLQPSNSTAKRSTAATVELCVLSTLHQQLLQRLHSTESTLAILEKKVALGLALRQVAANQTALADCLYGVNVTLAHESSNNLTRTSRQSSLYEVLNDMISRCQKLPP